MSLKVSIIIATYNSGKTLKQTLDSIRYQTYGDIETIVIDGGSKDNTIDIINEYDDVVTKYITEPDRGIYDAFNKGLRLATGDYVCFIGSDDCFYNYNVIESVVAQLNVDIDLLSTCGYAVHDDAREFWLDNNKSKEEILSGSMLPHAGIYVKTPIMKEYMFNTTNRIISDYEFLLRYVNDGRKITYVSFPTYYFSTEGISGNKYGLEGKKLLYYEHLRLFYKYDLDYKYYDLWLSKFMPMVHHPSIGLCFREFLKSILMKLGLLGIIKMSVGKQKKHKCSLKVCRWCKRS